MFCFFFISHMYNLCFLSYHFYLENSNWEYFQKPKFDIAALTNFYFMVVGAYTCFIFPIFTFFRFNLLNFCTFNQRPLILALLHF
jgi:hypothetical protein